MVRRHNRRETRRPDDDARHACWGINKLLEVLGCGGVVDCQPTTEPEIINVAFGFSLLRKNVNVHRRRFADYLKALPISSDGHRDAVLEMLERKFTQLLSLNTQQTNDNDN